MNEKQLTIAFSDLINHARYGKRNSAVAEATYDWILAYLQAGQAIASADKDPVDVAKITHSEVEGEYGAS